MGIAVKGLSEIQGLFTALGRFVNSGSREAVEDGAKEVAKGLQTLIALGKGADGTPMTPLNKATLEGPVRRQDNSRKRGDLGAKPLSATGDTARSIASKKVNSNTWEISSKTALGDAILASNAKGGGNDRPFGGDVRKAKRDPLQVTDKQVDILEDEIVKVLDRMLNGN